MTDCTVYKPFSTFQIYLSGQCTYPCFLQFLFISSLHNILSQPQAAFSHNTIVETMVSSERGKDPVVMDIINLTKETGLTLYFKETHFDASVKDSF